MQAQTGIAGDGVVDHLLLARAVRAGDEQVVQDADEERPLDGESEATSVQQIVHHRAQPQPLPEPSEQKGPPMRMQARRPASMSESTMDRSKWRANEAISRLS